MKKILFLAILLAGISFGQGSQAYKDSLYVGDSTNIHTFASYHDYIAVEIDSAVAGDTIYIYQSYDKVKWSKVAVREYSNPTNWVSLITGVASATENKTFLLYCQKARYIKLVRTAGQTTVKYLIYSL